MKILKICMMISVFYMFFCSKTEVEKITYKGEEVFKTKSGLMYKVKEEGSGKKVKAGNHIYLKYDAKIEDGRTLGESVSYIKAGREELFSGLEEGVIGMKIGGSRKLIIPPELGLGERGENMGIPTDATLIFNVKILPENKKIYKDEEYNITPTGLIYKDIKKGIGDTPDIGETVVTHYTGWLENGEKFDSSRDRGQPISFQIPGRVIKGWNEGIRSMRKGGIRKLVIPPHLGYGEKGAPPVIPKNATLIFEIELLHIKKQKQSAGKIEEQNQKK